MNSKSSSLIVILAIIFAFGVMMVFNTTSAEVLDRDLGKNIHHALIKQILYAIFGLCLARIMWAVGYHSLIRMSGSLLILFSILLVVVFIPGIGLQLNGARRWINLFGNSFQPSEFVKYIIPMFYIHKVVSREESLPFYPFLKLMAIIALPLGLILIEPDNGTVAIILSVMVALFILTRLRWTFWALPLLILVTVGAGVASQMSHVHDRIRIYMHPEQDLQGKGHQPYQAKIAAGSGRWTGKGLGESLQKLNYLPEARSDYIAAIFAEEFGFLGMLCLILAYLAVGFIGFSIAASAADIEGFYLGAVIVFLLCFQAFLNLGVVSGLLPSKGTNLPFFSQGGSSLLANFMAIGILLNIHKHSQQRKYAKS